jgi:dienelactone hydrolase
MEITEESSEKGVLERRFNLLVEGEIVPGIHWLPEGIDDRAGGGSADEHGGDAAGRSASGQVEGVTTSRPTVLIGHGGTQHKRAPNVLGLARKLVRARGYGVVALDAPGHGDRMTEAQREARAELFAGRQEGRLPPLSPERARALGMSAAKAVTEWKALLDDLTSNPVWATGPFGYWGVSMGTAFGVPLLADEPRISAAVLGLGALRSSDEAQRAQAARIRIPVLFLFQSDDELMSREGGLALWDAFGSTDKTMHINPGPHVGIPLFERDAAIAFYQRHLEG